MRSAAPCRDTPIDASRIVAGHVLTHLFEFKAAATVGAAMTAEKQSASWSARVQRQSVCRASQVEQLLQVEPLHGAGTFRSSSSTQACAVSPRACAP
jgi:hypothetical protein